MINMKSRINKLLAIIFMIYIFTFPILKLIFKDINFSYLENRVLQNKPKFNIQEFISGEYTKNFQKYIEDQFPMRNTFVSIKSYTELFMKRKENNDVYIGSDGYLLQKFNKPVMELTKKNLKYINDFSKTFNTYFLLAPTATKIHENKLPKYAVPYDEEEYINYIRQKLNKGVNFIPLINKLIEKNNEYIYYKTDHHWTTLGAYYAYVQFCKVYGIKALELNECDIIKASDNFYGSLFSKGNFTFVKPDTINIFEPKNKVKTNVNYVAEDKITNTLYEKKHLQNKDKYSIFLDNNHPIIEINTSIKSGKKLIILKDSYANCFIPFLINHFEEIHVLDLRFLNMPIPKYAKANNINDVLFIYNVQSFSNDNTFTLLRK